MLRSLVERYGFCCNASEYFFEVLRTRIKSRIVSCQCRLPVLSIRFRFPVVSGVARTGENIFRRASCCCPRCPTVVVHGVPPLLSTVFHRYRPQCPEKRARIFFAKARAKKTRRCLAGRPVFYPAAHRFAGGFLPALWPVTGYIPIILFFILACQSDAGKPFILHRFIFRVFSFFPAYTRFVLRLCREGKGGNATEILFDDGRG